MTSDADRTALSNHAEYTPITVRSGTAPAPKPAGEVEAAYRAGEIAMRERAAACADQWQDTKIRTAVAAILGSAETEHARKTAEGIAIAIKALEPQGGERGE